MRAQLAFPDPFDHALKAGAAQFRLAFHMLAPEHADDARAFQERQIERQLRNLAVGESDHEIASAPRDAAKRRFGIFAADGIEDHVRSVAAGERLEAFAQVLA
jgi:hypothetical protein